MNVGLKFFSSHLCQKNRHVPMSSFFRFNGQLMQRKRKLKVLHHQFYTQIRQTWAKAAVDLSPNSFQPYLRLMRADKPIGTWLLFAPCTWSISLATVPGTLPDLYLLSLFCAGSFFMRGAGCVINDLWDKDFDKKVARTKTRPLASGELIPIQAVALLGGLLSISLMILLQLNWYSVFLGTVSMIPVLTYPLAKRYTDWPQIALGLTFNWGALLGWAAVRGSVDWSIVLPLYAACLSWTMIYDTIYAHQDKTDDLLIGVKSTALTMNKYTKPYLAAFQLIMYSGLMSCGVMCNQTWPYYLGVSATAALISWQIFTVNLSDAKDCWAKFSANKYIGLIIFLSIVVGNLNIE